MAGPDAMVAYAQAQRARHLDELCALLRIPSVSTAGDHEAAMREAAEWLAARMRAAGLLGVELIETSGYPLLYGEWLGAPGKPTVLCYAHYDVQPPEPLALWTSPPFEPTVRGDNLYARGASDDKGQLYALLMAAEAAIQGSAAGCAVNLKFIFEGEEECGSVALKSYLAEHGDRLRADVALVADTAFYAPGVPAICLGLRGITYAEIEVQGASHDLHSGMYGGVAPNPLNALAHIIAGLQDRQGRVLIPGFYDDVVAPAAEERAAWRGLPFDERSLREEIGAIRLAGETAFDPLTRLWTRPTLDVHGIVGGYTGAGGKTVIPARASAKVSMRLVPNQRAEDIYERFARYVAQLAPEEVRITLHRYSADDPVLIAADHAAVRAAATAMSEVFAVPCALIRSGVTIPIVNPLQKHLGIPVLLMGFGLPDDQLHAPDEKLHLPNFYGGIEAVLRFWQRYGEGV
ncbi:MAG TPA: dipeptidase [Chloroflexota bacterium]|nr:dipeptidase [Chloroflexota bacterium]